MNTAVKSQQVYAGFQRPRANYGYITQGFAAQAKVLVGTHALHGPRHCSPPNSRKRSSSGQQISFASDGYVRDEGTVD